MDRLKNKEVLTRIRENRSVRNDRKARNEPVWDIHEKGFSDDEISGTNDIHLETERKKIVPVDR